VAQQRPYYPVWLKISGGPKRFRLELDDHDGRRETGPFDLATFLTRENEETLSRYRKEKATQFVSKPIIDATSYPGIFPVESSCISFSFFDRVSTAPSQPISWRKKCSTSARFAHA
jgi:hypothetical protein